MQRRRFFRRTEPPPLSDSKLASSVKAVIGAIPLSVRRCPRASPPGADPAGTLGRVEDVHGEVEVTDVDQDLEVLAHRHVVEDVGAGLGQGDLGLVDAVRCDNGDPQPSARCGGPGTHSRPRTEASSRSGCSLLNPLPGFTRCIPSSVEPACATPGRDGRTRCVRMENMNGPRQPSMFGARSGPVTSTGVPIGRLRHVA